MDKSVWAVEWGVGLAEADGAGAIGGVAGGKGVDKSVWAVEWGVGLAEADGAGAIGGVSEPPQASSKARNTNPIDKVRGETRESALGISVAPRPLFGCAKLGLGRKPSDD